MADQSSTGATWLDVLRTGISGYVDSQVAKNYSVNEAKYNTAQGTAGQAQGTAQVAQAFSSALPLLVVGGLVILAVVLLRK